MTRRSMFAGGLAIAAIMVTAASLFAQGRGTAPGQSLAAPVFDETLVVAAPSANAQFALPTNVVAAFDRAVVDIQVLEPPSPVGRATTSFVTVADAFGNTPAAALWSRFDDTITVFPNGFGTLVAGQEIRVRVFLHR